MNRRDSLKALVVGGISTAALLEACKQPAKDTTSKMARIGVIKHRRSAGKDAGRKVS